MCLIEVLLVSVNELMQKTLTVETDLKILEKPRGIAREVYVAELVHSHRYRLVAGVKIPKDDSGLNTLFFKQFHRFEDTVSSISVPLHVRKHHKPIRIFVQISKKPDGFLEVRTSSAISRIHRVDFFGEGTIFVFDYLLVPIGIPIIILYTLAELNEARVVAERHNVTVAIGRILGQPVGDGRCFSDRINVIVHGPRTVENGKNAHRNLRQFVKEQVRFHTEPIEMDGINTKKLVVNPDEAANIRLIFEMYAQPTTSYGDITRYFAEQGILFYGKELIRPTLAQMLRNPVYVQADLDVYEFFKSQGTVWCGIKKVDSLFSRIS